MYNEKEYWNNRLKTHGSINTSLNDSINEKEKELLLKYIKNEDCILDFGVGAGRLFPIYSKINGICVQGIDIADFKELINKKLQEVDKFVYNHLIYDKDLTEDVFPDNNFNVVVSFSVLTHIRPERIKTVINNLVRIGQITLISAYDDIPLAINNDNYCFSHDYKDLLKDYKIIETFKINTLRFWAIQK